MLRALLLKGCSRVATRSSRFPLSFSSLRAMSTDAKFKAAPLSVATLSPQAVKAQYAVRGKLVIRANEIEAKLQADPQNHGLPFEEIIWCNIGNPQVLGQKPPTYNRQVLSLSILDDLSDEHLLEHFPKDVVARAQRYKQITPQGFGAYTNSTGLANVHDSVAEFITKRDNTPNQPANPNDIYLTNGASQSVATALQLLAAGPTSGVLVPVPQYPLYSATLALLNVKQLSYYLDESKAWGIDRKSLTEVVHQARADGVTPNVLVVINPGNPTGQVLTKEDIELFIRVADEENLVLLADEVYQENIYKEGSRFFSFREVLLGMDCADRVPLVSFHSISKGFIGECGIRGGYMEIINFPKDVSEQLYKLASINLCANTMGQLSVDLMVKPPQQGEESFERYEAEKKSTLDSLKRKALMLESALNNMTNVTCNSSDGAMYLFPRLHLPQGAIDAAVAAGYTVESADAFYCSELLKATGICTVPGSGFHQVPGTYHYRTTILPSEAQIATVVQRTHDFNEAFMAQYS